jgi:hypothetical protein
MIPERLKFPRATDAGIQAIDSAVVTISGIDLAEKIKKG